MNEVTSPTGRVLGLQGGALDRLLPMHLWFDPSGRINRAGPTLEKLVDDGALTGRQVFDIVDIRKPRVLNTVDALLALDGQRLGVRVLNLPDLALRAQIQALPAGTGGLLNLSLGLGFAEAVEARGLTLSDFSPCDQTVDLLYLREAIRAISTESRRLTDRLIAAERAAQARATSDALTGLANRRALAEALDDRLEREGKGFAVMHVDLDFFKAVNDTLGHAAGDEVLIRVARVLRDEIRETDMAARVGGDEFVLVLDECEDPVILDRIARRLTTRLSEPMQIEGRPCRIGASIGTTRSSLYARPDADTMLRDADEALYASKAAGRGCHTFFRPPDGAGT